MSNFISHIATVEIPVTNLEKSIKFYTDVLGVEVNFKGEKDAMLSFKRSGAPTIYLVETVGFERLAFKNKNNDVVHSIIDFYTTSLEDFYFWLQENNIEVGTLNVNSNGVGGFGFQDPDGNVLGVTNILTTG